MKIVIDVDRLLQEGRISSEEYARLNALAVQETGSLAFNILIGFGVIATAGGALALLPSAYAHKYSPKKFTQHQLFACLVLKNFWKTDYRGVTAQLADCPELVETVMSMIKRRQGSYTRGVTHWSRCRDLRLLVLTHNILILVRVQVFYRAISFCFSKSLSLGLLCRPVLVLPAFRF